MNPPDDWLDLAEAAQILGIHQSTLRRWADAGRIAHVRTLSGRRRFKRASVEDAASEMQRSVSTQQAGQLELHALDLARQFTSEHRVAVQQGWFAHLNDDQRLLFRYSGQRLLGLMMQFISRSDSADKFLEEGKRVAGDYGRICLKAGLSISQTAEAFLYFRRSILETVQATSGLGGPDDQDGHRIFLRTIDFFDSMLVATMESYAQSNQSG